MNRLTNSIMSGLVLGLSISTLLLGITCFIIWDFDILFLKFYAATAVIIAIVSSFEFYDYNENYEYTHKTEKTRR